MDNLNNILILTISIFVFFIINKYLKNIHENFDQNISINKNTLDTTFYKIFYDDIYNFNDEKLIKHYQISGKKEGRLKSHKDFYDMYPQFDVNIYKYLNNELGPMNDILLMKHYHYNGHKEGRKCSIKDLIEKKIDISIYKKFQNKYNETDDIIINNCISNKLYLNKKYIYNIDDFFILYPTFNVKIYRLFNIKNNNISDIDVMAYFYHSDKENIVYSVKDFYNIYPEFDYYIYKKKNKDNKNIVDLDEVDTIIYWYKNDKTYNFLKNIKKTIRKNILIYLHMNFDLSNGGVTVQYYLASILSKMGEKVRIYSNINKQNILFNIVYDKDEVGFDLNNTVVVYCEGIIGNPLNAKYVVRWILSELGTNVEKDRYLSWDKEDLVYYFNSELKFNNKQIHKLLSLVFIYPKIKNYNQKRDGYCHTIRKSHIHKNKINYIHPSNSFEIMRNHTQDDYIEIFNKYKYFISYDPLTFINIIASLCGCISIVYPIDGISKSDWYKMTAFKNYMEDKNVNEIYGIAYGNSESEIIYANNTIHLVTKQWKDIINYYKNKSVIPFINDINNWESNINTVQNNFYE